MELLEQFVRGDLEAFEALFRQFQRMVYGWIIRIVRDRGVAEDLTVETFWRIYKAHTHFDPNRSFCPWARRIATNVALDYLKRVRPEVELVESMSREEPPDPALRRDMQERIARAFSGLPAKLRMAATLALIEERTYAEIAEALGISVGGVKSRVFRAVRRLRKVLKAQGVVP